MDAANRNYPKSEEDEMRQLDTLAAYYVKLANRFVSHSHSALCSNDKSGFYIISRTTSTSDYSSL